MLNIRGLFVATSLAVATVATSSAIASVYSTAEAASAQDLDTDAKQALANLYKSNPVAKSISEKATAVLVFPNIVKAGLVFGGAYGEGVMMQNGKANTYYNTLTGSWGLQAGAQSYGYAVFLMNDDAVKYIHDTKGLEIGVGPTVVVVDEGIAKNLSTSTLKEDAYAFTFDQQGLMAGISIEGTKISEIER